MSVLFVLGCSLSDDVVIARDTATRPLVVDRLLGGGRPCTDPAQCATGFCVDGVCCDVACGGGLTSDCLSCLGSQTGSADGVCANILATASHVCRAGSGDMCDPDEVCDGMAPSCPVDVVAPAITVCNAGSGDACDPDETCTGTAGQTCPTTDDVAAAGTSCRMGSGDACDPDETCTGVPDQACPADVVAPAGTVCAAGSGDLCDPDDTCSGAASEPCAIELAPAGTICRTGSGDSCDPDELCTGVESARCPIDASEPDDTDCDDGHGLCNGGICEQRESTPLIDETIGVPTDPTGCACTAAPSERHARGFWLVALLWALRQRRRAGTKPASVSW